MVKSFKGMDPLVEKLKGLTDEEENLLRLVGALKPWGRDKISKTVGKYLDSRPGEPGEKALDALPKTKEHLDTTINAYKRLKEAAKHGIDFTKVQPGDTVGWGAYGSSADWSTSEVDHVDHEKRRVFLSGGNPFPKWKSADNMYLHGLDFDTVGAHHTKDWKKHQYAWKVNEEGEAPTNTVGSGHVAGCAPGESPPVTKKKQTQYQRHGTMMAQRMKPAMIDEDHPADIFKVGTDVALVRRSKKTGATTTIHDKIVYATPRLVRTLKHPGGRNNWVLQNSSDNRIEHMGDDWVLEPWNESVHAEGQILEGVKVDKDALTKFLNVASGLAKPGEDWVDRYSSSASSMFPGVDKAEFAKRLQAASEAHHAYEKGLGKPDANWAGWYANHMTESTRLDRNRLNAPFGNGMDEAERELASHEVGAPVYVHGHGDGQVTKSRRGAAGYNLTVKLGDGKEVRVPDTIVVRRSVKESAEPIQEGWRQHDDGTYTAWGAEIDHHEGKVRCPKCRKEIGKRPATLRANVDRDNDVTHWEGKCPHGCGAKLTVWND